MQRTLPTNAVQSLLFFHLFLRMLYSICNFVHANKQTKNKSNIIIVMTFRCVVMKYIIYSIYLRASVVPMETRPLHLVRCVKLHGNMCACDEH